MAKNVTKVYDMTGASEEVQEIVADYRKTYGTDPTASVADIQKLWDDSDEGIGARDVREAEGFEDEAEETTDTKPLVSDAVRAAVAISTQDRDKDAVALARKLAKSALLLADLADFVETESKRKRLPAIIALDFQATLSKDDIQGAPEPGLRYDDVPEGSNVKYDVRKAGEGSYYADVADELPEGQTYLVQIRALKNALDDNEKTPDQYKGKSVSWLQGELTTVSQRRNTLKSAVKAGMTLCKRMYMLADMTLLKARIRTELSDTSDPKSRKVVLRTAVPIQVYYLEGEGEEKHVVDKHVGIGAFNRVDFGAIGKLATADAQLQAFASKRKRGEGASKDDNVVIQNIRQVESACAEFAAMSSDAKVQADMLLELMKDENADFLISVFKTASFFDRIVGKPALRKRYQDVVTAKAAAEKAEEQAAA